MSYLPIRTTQSQSEIDFQSQRGDYDELNVKYDALNVKHDVLHVQHGDLTSIVGRMLANLRVNAFRIAIQDMKSTFGMLR